MAITTSLVLKRTDYPIYSRKGSLSANEEILFNCNELAKGHS
jgi:oligopeptidase B